MRTRIRCGWLVGHAGGHHTLWRDAELVFEGNSVLFVGERFEGAVDREIDARDKLVAPGFIDTHVHSGHRASHRLISDIGRGDYFGQLSRRYLVTVMSLPLLSTDGRLLSHP